MVSRLLVPLLCITALVAACGGEEAECASATTDANGLLRATVANLPEMRSATVDLNLTAGGRGGLRLQGPFSAEEDGRLPRFAFAASLGSGERSLKAGVTWTGEEGYVALQGTAYEVSPLVMGQIAAGYEQALKDGKRGGLLLGGIDFSSWVRNARNEGLARVGDDETIKLTGRADAQRVLADLDTLSTRAGSLSLPGVGGMLPGRLTPKQREAATKAAEAMTITVHTGATDRILRRLIVTARNLSFDVTFSDVGEDQEIDAPAGARPFSELVKMFEAAGFGHLGGALGGGHDRERSKRGAQNNVDKYAECLREANGDRAKGRKCASLLSG